MLEKALHTKVEIINKNIIFNNKLYLIFKSIGLFITDGYFSEIYNNFSYKKQIYFSGLTKETAKSILKTFTPISHKLYVDSIINNYKKYYRIRLYPHFLFYKYLYNIIYNKIRTRFLRSVEPHHKVWLLSGIIDGDGYIGKKYISISYKKN
ncbi:MAG: hypothetical protein F7C33_02980, partial [Desulfurococcales archaeon]|nr:hypothetical protein [Desulfurococcales archaeon]